MSDLFLKVYKKMKQQLFLAILTLFGTVTVIHADPNVERNKYSTYAPYMGIYDLGEKLDNMKNNPKYINDNYEHIREFIGGFLLSRDGTCNYGEATVYANNPTAFNPFDFQGHNWIASGFTGNVGVTIGGHYEKWTKLRDFADVCSPEGYAYITEEVINSFTKYGTANGVLTQIDFDLESPGWDTGEAIKKAESGIVVANRHGLKVSLTIGAYGNHWNKGYATYEFNDLLKRHEYNHLHIDEIHLMSMNYGSDGADRANLKKRILDGMDESWRRIHMRSPSFPKNKVDLVIATYGPDAKNDDQDPAMDMSLLKEINELNIDKGFGGIHIFSINFDAKNKTRFYKTLTSETFAKMKGRNSESDVLADYKIDNVSVSVGENTNQQLERTYTRIVKSDDEKHDSFKYQFRVSNPSGSSDTKIFDFNLQEFNICKENITTSVTKDVKLKVCLLKLFDGYEMVTTVDPVGFKRYNITPSFFDKNDEMYIKEAYLEGIYSGSHPLPKIGTQNFIGNPEPIDKFEYRFQVCKKYSGYKCLEIKVPLSLRDSKPFDQDSEFGKLRTQVLKHSEYEDNYTIFTTIPAALSAKLDE